MTQEELVILVTELRDEIAQTRMRLEYMRSDYRLFWNAFKETVRSLEQKLESQDNRIKILEDKL